LDDDSEIAKSLACFDFKSPPLADDAMLLTCRRVWEQGQLVRLVYHDAEGGFQFLCDGNEHEAEAETVFVHAHHLFDRGAEQLRDFTYLRRAYWAEHLHDNVWNLAPIPKDDA
jgi:hypothetical protein